MAYSRALFPPGSGCAGGPGTAINYDESVDAAFDGSQHFTVTRPDGGCNGSHCAHPPHG